MVDSIDNLIQQLQKKSVSSLGGRILLAVDESWVLLDGMDGAVKQQEERVEADCVVKLSLKDLSEIISGHLDPTTAFMLNKVEITGDLAMAMKLQSLLT